MSKERIEELRKIINELDRLREERIEELNTLIDIKNIFVKVELIRQTGDVIISQIFNTNQPLLTWEAPIGLSIVGNGIFIDGFEIKLSTRPIKNDNSI